MAGRSEDNEWIVDVWMGGEQSVFIYDVRFINTLMLCYKLDNLLHNTNS